MFDGVVLGVDPGTAAMGLAAVRGHPGSRAAVEWSTTVRTPPGLPAAERLLRIHDSVQRAIHDREPEALAIERLMWGRNAPSGMEVARASGVVVLAAAEAGIDVEEYAPLEVKMAVTGLGNAPKDAVRRGLARLLGVLDVPSDPDAADAVAVALCHLQQARVRRATREAAGR
jgi:crossover junction endodeoxyribonuclease RuvC